MLIPMKILLSIAAVISLALGLFQDFGTPREPGEPPVDWVEGVAIMIAIAIVVRAILVFKGLVIRLTLTRLLLVH